MTNVKTSPSYAKLLTLATLGLFALNAQAAAPSLDTPIKEGLDYTIIAPTKSAIPSVEMMMSFNCAHCDKFTNEFHVPQKLEALLKEKYPQYKFEEFQIILPDSAHYDQLGRMMSIMKLTKNMQLFPAAYKVPYQYKGDPVVYQQFLADGMGKSLDYIKGLWNSFSVNTYVKKQKDLTAKYHITQTPTFVVDGKYAFQLGGLGRFIEGQAMTPDQLGNIIVRRLELLIQHSINEKAGAAKATDKKASKK